MELWADGVVSLQTPRPAPVEQLQIMSRAKVLIIEDNALVSVSLEDMLLSAGFEVVGTAETATEALYLAEVTKPDVAITDVRLAGRGDGIEAATLLRDQLAVRVIFLTAFNDDVTRRRAAAVKPVAYLVKPVRPRDLIVAVDAASCAKRTS